MEPDTCKPCTFVGKRGFLFAQTRLDVNLDVDSTVDIVCRYIMLCSSILYGTIYMQHTDL